MTEFDRERELANLHELLAAHFLTPWWDLREPCTEQGLVGIPEADRIAIIGDALALALAETLGCNMKVASDRPGGGRALDMAAVVSFANGFAEMLVSETIAEFNRHFLPEAEPSARTSAIIRDTS